MPDSGFNSYLAINPDGTVVVPNNIDPAGVISAGDLASHSDIDAAIAAAIADLASTAYADDAAWLAASSKVDGTGLQIDPGPESGYFAHLVAAGANLTHHVVDVGGVGSLGWAQYIPVGYWLGDGHVALSNAQPFGDTLRLWFTSLSSGLQNIDGYFYFCVIGRP